MPNLKKQTKKKSSKTKGTRSGDIPASKAMLDELEGKVTHQIASLRFEMSGKFKGIDAKFKEVDARFSEVDARFNQVDARFNQVDARFNQVDARLDRMDSKIDQVSAKIETVLSAVHKVGLLVEEQNARNKFVLDGYTSLNDRVEKLERRTGDKDI